MTRNRRNNLAPKKGAGKIPAGVLTWFILTGVFVYIDNRFQLSGTTKWFSFIGIFAPPIVAVLVVRLKPISMLKQVIHRRIHGHKKEFGPGIDKPKSSMKSSISQAPIEVTKDMHTAAQIFFKTGQVSISMIQRKMMIGYSRAANLVDGLELAGVIGPFEGIKPRKILIDEEEYFSRYRIVSTFSDVLPRHIKENSPDCFDRNQIIQDEMTWRRGQMRLSPVQYELQRIDGMEGHEFEYWCAELLKKNGYIDVEVTKGSGDQGVDVLAFKDGIKYAIQCKCYASDLGNRPIQEVYAGRAIYSCQIGIVMTNRRFTASAKELAKATGVLLWDREKLEEMLTAAAP